MTSISDADVFSTSADAPSWVSPLYQKATVGGEVVWSSGGSGSTAFSTGSVAIPPNTWTQITETFTSASGSTKADLVFLAGAGTPGDQWFFSEHQFYQTSVGTNLLTAAQQGNQSTPGWGADADTSVISQSTARTHGGNTFSTLVTAVNSGSAPTNFSTEASSSGLTTVSAGPLGFTWTFWVYWIPGNNSDGQASTVEGVAGAADAIGSLRTSPATEEASNSATESFAITANVSDTDAVAGADAYLSLGLTSADVLSGLDTSLLFASFQATDVLSGVDAANVFLTDFDVTYDTDTIQDILTGLGGDTFTGLDALAPVAASIASADLASGTDAATSTAALVTSGDLGTSIDLPNLSIHATAADTGSGNELASVSALVSSSDVFASAVDVPVFGVRFLDTDACALSDAVVSWNSILLGPDVLSGEDIPLPMRLSALDQAAGSETLFTVLQRDMDAGLWSDPVSFTTSQLSAPDLVSSIDLVFSVTTSLISSDGIACTDTGGTHAISNDGDVCAGADNYKLMPLGMDVVSALELVLAIGTVTTDSDSLIAFDRPIKLAGPVNLQVSADKLGTGTRVLALSQGWRSNGDS
jgi:hypothetical protein